MRSTEVDAAASADDHAYFRALEAAFLRLRGSATLLAAADWQVAREWRHAGVPIDLVVEVMERLFARQRERAPRRGISSLRYFRAAVAAAWDEQLERAAGAWREPAGAEPTVGERLAALAGRLPAELPGRAELAAAMLALEGDLATVEPALARLEAQALAGLDRDLARAEREAVDAEVAAALAPVRDRLPAAAVDAAARRLWTQALRRRYGLPLLSLFAPEAQPPHDEDPG